MSDPEKAKKVNRINNGKVNRFNNSYFLHFFVNIIAWSLMKTSCFKIYNWPSNLRVNMVLSSHYQ